MPRWRQARGVVKDTDVEMRLARHADALASQGRAAAGAEAARRPPGRRFKAGDLALGDGVVGAVVGDKHRHRRAGVAPAALAMAPVDALWRAAGDKPHRAAQAAAGELLQSLAHSAPPHWRRAEQRSAFRRLPAK